MDKIPLKYKCSKCKKDMREKAKKENKCKCNKDHPNSFSKSGNPVWSNQIQYDGPNLEY